MTFYTNLHRDAMNHHHSQMNKQPEPGGFTLPMPALLAGLHYGLLILVAACLARPLQAQIFPGGGGGGFGAGVNRNNNSSSRYPASGDVGDAVISIDPETRSLIVIADEKTKQYISQVVSNLDRPK